MQNNTLWEADHQVEKNGSICEKILKNWYPFMQLRFDMEKFKSKQTNTSQITWLCKDKKKLLKSLTVLKISTNCYSDIKWFPSSDIIILTKQSFSNITMYMSHWGSC